MNEDRRARTQKISTVSGAIAGLLLGMSVARLANLSAAFGLLIALVTAGVVTYAVWLMLVRNDGGTGQ